MKNLFLFIALVTIFANSNAQGADSIQKHRYYCEIMGVATGVTTSSIKIDFGDKTLYPAGLIGSKLDLVDEDGKKVRFKNIVDAANYLSSKGWTFQQAYTTTFSLGSPSSIVHWIFYKDAINVEDALKGITTKDEYKANNK